MTPEELRAEREAESRRDDKDVYPEAKQVNAFAFGFNSDGTIKE